MLLDEKRLNPWRAVLLGAALALTGGCDTGAPPEEPTQEARPPEEIGEPALHPERRGIGAMVLPPRGPSALAVTVDPRSSLMVTDQVILTNFPFKRVMDQLVTQSGVPGLTSLQLFHEWWDSANPAPGLGLGGPHCNDQIFGGQPSLNTFPYLCPRSEGSQATVDPFINPGTNPNEYLPAALVNRFDLAPANGADCGEYRIVYVKRSGITNPGNRNLIIFEAVLPNPNPTLGLNGCRPVADFWAKLTGVVTNPSTRATMLADFYFLGLSGFMPVVHIDNYGNRTSTAGAVAGQVRSNQFMQGPWTLREFKVRRQLCGTVPCALRFNPVTVKTNPGGTLFNPASGHPQAPAFQGGAFPAQVPSLAVNDLNLFNLAVSDTFNSGQSNAQGPENDYLFQFGPGPSPFHTNIQGQLTSIGSTLTPQNVVSRSLALSCAGCHQFSNNVNLGGGLIWPPSAGFVHVTEQQEPGPNGPRFIISPALNTVFLPHRKAVFETFLNSSCGDAICQPWETHASCTVDCP